MDDDFTGAKLALFIGGELLITLRDDFAHIPFPNVWDFPGGGRDAGETPLQCMHREVIEEVGLVIPEGAIIWQRRYQRDWFFVAVMPAGFERGIVFGDEGQGWRLVTLDAFFALTDVVPHFPQQVRDWLSDGGDDALKKGADRPI